MTAQKVGEGGCFYIFGFSEFLGIRILTKLLIKGHSELVVVSLRSLNQKLFVPIFGVMDVLGIDGVVTSGKQTFASKKIYVLKARVVEKPTKCPTCHAGKPHYHDERPLGFFDVPSGNFRVFVEMQVTRYRCKNCNSVFPHRPEGLAQKHRLTTRCLEYIAEESMKDTFREIGRKVGCDDQTVRSVAKKHIARLRAEHPPYLPQWLAIDETHLGKKEYCVLSDLDRKRSVDLLTNTRGVTVSRWLSNFPRKPIPKGVTMDMTKRYRNAMYDYFPGVLVVIDKFHVVDKAKKSLDDWCNRLAEEKVQKNKEDKSEKGKKAQKTTAHTGRRDRALIQVRAHKLGSMTRTLMRDAWLKNEPELQKAYWLKEELFKIYDCKTRDEAAAKLEEWRAKVNNSPRMRQAFRKVLTCTKNWKFEILAYFYPNARKTNAFAEQQNRKAKAIYRQGRRLEFDMIRAKLLYGDHEKLGNARLYNSTATVRKQRNSYKRPIKRDDRMLVQIRRCDNLQGVREKLVAQEGHHCHRCGAANPDDRLELHYGRLPKDKADEFMVVCPNCHEEIHQMMDESHK